MTCRSIFNGRRMPRRSDGLNPFVPRIPRFPRFFNINVSRFSIISFSRRRFGHGRQPAHAFRLNLNSFPYCPRHNEILVCDFCYIIFDCPFLFLRKKIFKKVTISFLF